MVMAEHVYTHCMDSMKWIKNCRFFFIKRKEMKKKNFGCLSQWFGQVLLFHLGFCSNDFLIYGLYRKKNEKF